MPDAPAFVFGIPLIARSAAYDWDVVVHHFNATLGSIFNQTDPNFRVIVACTGRPEVRIPVDERLEFVDVPDRARVDDFRLRYGDIMRRRHAILGRIDDDRDAYVMFVDADDLVSHRLVAHIRERNNPFGHYVAKGYAFDTQRRLMSELPTESGENISFHYVCGTSFILRLSAKDRRNLRGPKSYFACVLRKGHPGVRRFSIAEGRPLAPIPFPAVIYVRNYGSNMSERPDYYSEATRALRAEVVKRIARGAVKIDERTVSEFALDPLLEETGRGLELRPPSLTVAIATYRRAEGLRRLLTALRPQVEGRGDREIVVVNDGSHDVAYEEVVKSFGTMVRYDALAENGGVSVARNRALALAGGDYVVFIDDDCLPPPYWLDWLAGRLLASPDIDVVAGTTRLFWRKRALFERVQAHNASASLGNAAGSHLRHGKRCHPTFVPPAAAWIPATPDRRGLRACRTRRACGWLR